jgi:hypothetical protein
MMAAPKAQKTFSKKDFIPIKVGGVEGLLNTVDGSIKLPAEGGALSEAVSADRKISEMNVASLKAMRKAGIENVVLTKDGKYIDAKTAPRTYLGLGGPEGRVISIKTAIAEETKTDATNAFIDAPE